MRRTLRNHLSKAVRDEAGAALLLFTIMLPVILGLIALSIDAGRYMNLHTELQDLADAASLAAAKSLDGKDDSMERAVAAGNAIKNDPRWSSTPLGDGPNLTFRFSKLIDDGELTYDPKDQRVAQFVKVTTRAWSFTGSFIAAVSSETTQSTFATATAGSTVIACKVPPLMICAPGGDLSKLPTSLVEGRLYRLKGGGGDKSPAPGAYGLLDTPGRNTSGTNEVRNNLARPDPNICFLSKMSRRNGVATSTDDAVNVRFDIYPNSPNSDLRNYPPAPTVIKGMYLDKPKQCTWAPLAGGEPLSHGATETPDTVMGGGSTAPLWPNRDKYWQVNHQAKQGAMPADIKTRYGMYLWELQNYPNRVPTSPENGKPNQCWGGTAPTAANADRRVIYAAVLDCSGSQVEVKLSTAYLKFFITEPASGGTIYAEYIGKEELGGKSGVLHHIVQLYRDY